MSPFQNPSSLCIFCTFNDPFLYVHFKMGLMGVENWCMHLCRRAFTFSASVGAVLTGAAIAAALPKPTLGAAGTDIFKAPLHNRYFLVRAGETVRMLSMACILHAWSIFYIGRSGRSTSNASE